MTAWERLQLLVGGLGEEQAERALELLSPLIGANARPGQQVRQLPAFVGIGDSGRSDISEHVDDLLAGLVRQYADLRLGGTDASVIAIGERLGRLG